MKHCIKRNGVHISFLPYINKVGIAKCCLKSGLSHILLKSYTLEEWKKSNKFLEIKTCKGHNVNDGYATSVPSSLCKDEKICDFPNAEILDVDLSLSYFCNAKCSFCSVDKNISDELKKSLYETYMQTLQELKGHSLRNLRLTDKGEPFFYKKELLEFLQTLDYDKDFNQIEVTTNGSYIDNEFIETIKNSNINYRVVVSLNAASKETRKNIMGLDDFDKVFKFGKDISSLISDFSFSFVVCESNKNEILDFFNMCYENNIKPTIMPAWIGGIPHNAQIFYKEYYQNFIKYIQEKVDNKEIDSQFIENIQFKPYI